MSAKYKIGVVGAGTAFQMALPVLKTLGSLAISHLEPGIPPGTADFHFYPDASRMLRSGEVQFAYIATPVASHQALAIQSASQGIPTLLEKPLFLHLSDAHSIAADLRPLIFPAFRKRYSSAARSIKRLHQLSPTGKASFEYTWLAPFPGDSHWKIKREVSGGGVTMDIVCHMLDLVEHCVGNVSSICVMNAAMHPTQRTDTYLDITGSASANVTYKLRAGWANRESIQVLRYNSEASEVIWIKRGSEPDSQLSIIEGTRAESLTCDRSEEYAPMFADFLNFRDTPSMTLPLFQAGLRNLELIDQIHRTFKWGPVDE